jgi:AcrR family transcriptional regulator
VERIIRAGGVSRSTFYAYFDDKGDLLRAMAEHVISELLDAGLAWWTLPADGTKDDLREALRPAVDTYREHHAVLGAVIETATYDARVREAHVRLVNEVVASLAAHIREHQKQGSACPDLDARRTAEWLIWMDERGLYQVVSRADDREAERLLGALTDIVWRTLYAGYREEA